MTRIFFIACLLASFSCFSQELTFSDNTKSIGVNIIDQGVLLNTEKCLVIDGLDSIFYSPEEIKSYTLSNGAVYVSKKLPDGKILFLKQLSTGNHFTLYFYRSSDGVSFFFEKVNTTDLLQLPKDYMSDPPDYLKENMGAVKNLQFAVYRRQFLKRLTALINNGETKPIIYPNLGISGGTSFASLTKGRISFGQAFEEIEFNHEFIPQLGIFGEIPVYEDIACRLELNFSQISSSYSALQPLPDKRPAFYDLIINMKSLDMPFIVRYYIPVHKYHPFLNSGVVYSHNIQYDYSYFRSEYSAENIDIYKLEHTGLECKDRYGYSIGAGLAVDFYKRSKLSLEVRYTKLVNIDTKSLGLSGIGLIAGFSF